jgi:hypothetical protein
MTAYVDAIMAGAGEADADNIARAIEARPWPTYEERMAVFSGRPVEAVARSVQEGQHMRPMSEFNPSASAMVHDRLNDRTFEWKPEWRAAYEKHAARHAPGVIEFDGLLLDGWNHVTP